MKSLRIGVIMLLIVIGFSAVNTLFLSGAIERLCEGVSSYSIEDGDGCAMELYSDFKALEAFASLTVSHEDLTNIEDLFVEVISYSKIGDKEGLFIAKSRLENALLHLGRLIRLNIDSVF